MRERRLHRALIALAAIATVPGAARAQPVPRVGVAVATQVNTTPAEAQAMSEALGKALHDELMVDVIAGTEAARRLPEAGIADNCVVDKACIADVAQRLSADQILFLVVVKVGGRVQVDSTWADAATGKTVSRPAVVIEAGQEPQAQFAAAAQNLMPDAAPRPDAPVIAPPPGGDAAPEGPTFLTRQRPRRMTTPAWVAAGVGGAALAGAVTFTLLTRSGYQDCEGADCSDGRLDSIENKALAADLLWGTAVVAGAAAGVLYWMSGGQMEQVPIGSGVSIGPGPGSVGLAIGGRL